MFFQYKNNDLICFRVNLHFCAFFGRWDLGFIFGCRCRLMSLNLMFSCRLADADADAVAASRLLLQTSGRLKMKKKT